MNKKRLFRLYKEDGLAVRRRRGDLVVSDVNVTNALARIDIPLLVVLSNKDGIVPPQTALSVCDAWGGKDIEIPLALSFEEAFKGLTTNITVNRSEQCSRCNGAGDTGGPVVQCSTCKGTGQVMRSGGRLQFSQEPSQSQECR